VDQLISRLRAAGCVFAEDEARLLAAEAPDEEALESMVARRVSGVPLEVVVGWAEFCGLRIPVTEGVFVPRRRTELLAQQAISHASAGDIVVELCCGTGAVSAALLAAKEGLEVYAADIDPAAVACARSYLQPRATVLQSDLYQAFPDALRGRVGVVVANAPYVPSAELDLLPREARQFEPTFALEGGSDGLQILLRVFAEAPHWLAPGGHVLGECSEEQAPVLAEWTTSQRLTVQTVSDAESGATVVIGTSPAAGD
jgi:release factor glutamine methyltransferase